MEGVESLEQHKVIAYARNVILAGQQMGVQVANAVDNDFEFSEPGKQFTAEFAGERKMTEVKERFQKSPNNVQTRERRVGHFRTFDDGEVLEDRDEAETLVNMSSPIVQSMGAALARQRDEEVIAAAIGNSYKGETGSTTVALPASQKIAINSWKFHRGAADGDSAPTGNAPLTPAKVRHAKNILDNSKIRGRRIMLYSPDQLNLMLTSKEVSTEDYGMIAKLEDGEINRWLGFDWVRSDQLPIAGNVRKCIAMIGDTVHYRARTLKRTRITERPDLSYAWYAYMRLQHGAVRTQDKGVVEIACDES